MGTFLVERPYAIISAIGVILAAVYLLWAFQRVFTGEPEGENKGLKDLDMRELTCVAPLLLLSLFLGLYPRPILDRVQPSVKNLVHYVESNTKYKEPQPHRPSVQDGSSQE